MSNISGLIDAEFTHPHESYTYYYARNPVNVTWVGGTDQVSLIKYCEEQGPEDLTLNITNTGSYIWIASPQVDDNDARVACKFHLNAADGHNTNLAVSAWFLVNGAPYATWWPFEKAYWSIKNVKRMPAHALQIVGYLIGCMFIQIGRVFGWLSLVFIAIAVLWGFYSFILDILFGSILCGMFISHRWRKGKAEVIESVEFENEDVELANYEGLEVSDDESLKLDDDDDDETLAHQEQH